MRKLDKVSEEVFKYPYEDRKIESEDFLSEKICSGTIRMRKRVIQNVKWLLVYIDLISRLRNPCQAIGLPLLPSKPVIMKSINSNAGLSKQAIISQVINNNQ